MGSNPTLSAFFIIYEGFVSSIYKERCYFMLLFYLLFLTIVVLLLMGGYDATMRLVIYIDLRIRQFFLDIRIWFFKRKLKKRILKDQENLLKEMENNNHAK